MKNNRLSAREWGERILLALLFTAVGSLIMIVFSPWKPLLERVSDYLGRIGLIVFLVIAALLLRRSKRYQKYQQIALGLVIMAVAVSLDWVLGIYLIDYLGINSNTPAGYALLKLNECAVVVCVIIFLTRSSGGSLGSIYVQKGNLELGLTIGLIAFFTAAAGSIPMANLMFQGQNLIISRIIPWIPWVLIFVLANGILEELLFRGLFLQKLEPYFRGFLSNFLIAFVFTVLHRGAAYTSEEYPFLVVLFLLALAWGYITQKTGGLWGSILFHAGMDIPIVLGIFSNIT